MAKSKPTKNELFSKDLSNYTQIRRGLTPEMRKLVPSKKEVTTMSQDVIEKLIDSLNKYRASGYSKKRGPYDLPTAEEQQMQRIYEQETLTSDQKGILATALLNVKGTSYEEGFERIKTTPTMETRGRDWYSAKTEQELGKFDVKVLIRDARDTQLRLIYQDYQDGNIILDEDDADEIKDYLDKKGYSTISTVARETLTFAEELNKRVASTPKGFKLQTSGATEAEVQSRREYAKRIKSKAKKK